MEKLFLPGSSRPSATSIASSALQAVTAVVDAASKAGEDSSKVARAVNQVRPFLDYIEASQRQATGTALVVIDALSQVGSALDKVQRAIESRACRVGLISRLIQMEAMDARLRSAVADLAQVLLALPWPSLALPTELESSVKMTADQLQKIEWEEMSSAMPKVSPLREELRRGYSERRIRSENIQSILQGIIAEYGEEAYKDLVITDILELKEDMQNAQSSHDRSEENELLQIVFALGTKYISNRLEEFASQHRSRASRETKQNAGESGDGAANQPAGVGGASAPDANADVDMKPPEEFLCPITQKLLERPYVLLESGITYEFDVICEWLCTEYKFDPQTSRPLFSMLLTPNVALQRQIDAWKAERGLPTLESKERGASRSGKISSWDYVFIIKPAKEKREKRRAEQGAGPSEANKKSVDVGASSSSSSPSSSSSKPFANDPKS